MKPDATEQQVASFIARYTPDMATALTACRAKLRARVPRGYELVYDNYNARRAAAGRRRAGAQPAARVAR